jgi:hypothetical protein
MRTLLLPAMLAALCATGCTSPNSYKVEVLDSDGKGVASATVVADGTASPFGDTSVLRYTKACTTVAEDDPVCEEGELEVGVVAAVSISLTSKDRATVSLSVKRSEFVGSTVFQGLDLPTITRRDVAQVVTLPHEGGEFSADDLRVRVARL